MTNLSFPFVYEKKLNIFNIARQTTIVTEKNKEPTLGIVSRKKVHM